MDNTNNTDILPVDNIAKPKQGKEVIDVERDFEGNLEDAIAAAEDGDVVSLGAKVYETQGVKIDKDITLDGVEGTVLNGGGTYSPIIDISEAGSGATISDMEITDANIGVQGLGASDLTLSNLEVHNIGNDEIVREGQNNVGISLTYADGFKVLDSQVYDISRKGVGINDTDGGIVSGLTVEDINLDAQHAQSFDAGGIKLFNTNDVTVSDNELSSVNAFHIWNDITNGTVIEDNTVTGVGEDFLAPEFNQNVTVSGIYNEKSVNSVVEGNTVDSVGRFIAFDATAFTTETMMLGENEFSSIELDTTDYWSNEQAERIVAITEDPAEANFNLFADDFFNDTKTNIGDGEADM